MNIEIIVGSVLGASEYVAEACQQLLTNKQISSRLHLQPVFDDINIQSPLLIISSTHGAGDLPDNIQSFVETLESNKLDNNKVMIIGLGDSSYDTFCFAADTIAKTITDSGGSLCAPILKIDVLQHQIPEDYAIEWFEENYNKLI